MKQENKVRSHWSVSKRLKLRVKKVSKLQKISENVLVEHILSKNLL